MKKEKMSAADASRSPAVKKLKTIEFEVPEDIDDFEEVDSMKSEEMENAKGEELPIVEKVEVSPDENSSSSSNSSEWTREDEIRARQENEKERYDQLLALMKKSDLFVKMIFQRVEESNKKAENQIQRLKKPGRKRSAPVRSSKGNKRRRRMIESESEEDEEEEESKEQEDTDEKMKLFTGGTLKDYQVEGVKWLTSLYENGISGILADEMGLGKTVQVIATVAWMIENGVTGPFLIVAPLSTITNWANEFRRFAPRIPIIFYHAAKEDREDLRAKIRRAIKLSNDCKVHPVLISSYDIVKNDAGLLRSYHWKTVVIDEGHRLKNRNCVLLKQLKKLNTNYRLLLTGTPLQNNLQELWSLLNFILPEIFSKLHTFEEWFDRGALKNESGRQQIINQEKEKRVLSMMHQILTPFMLRRLKTDVDLSIPPKREIILHAALTSYQQHLYNQVLDRTIHEMRRRTGEIGKKEFIVEIMSQDIKRECRANAVIYDDDYWDNDIFDSEMNEDEKEAATKIECPTKSIVIHGNSVNLDGTAKYEIKIQMANPLMILRKIVNHAHLIEYPLDRLGEYCLDDRLIENGGKIQILHKLLPALKSRGHKVLIFSQFTSMLDILQDYFNYVGFKYSRIDGNMKLEERNEQIKWFFEEEDIFIFLISTRAGGLGLNLTAADTVIFYDSDWNPQCDIQAQDRCHRIGQTKPVLIYRLLIPGTVEEKIYDYANNKKTLGRLIIHGKRFKKSLKSREQWNGNKFDIGDDELMKLLTHRDEEATVEVKAFDDDYLSNILDRSDLIKQWMSEHS